MTLPTSGPLSLNDIQTEFGGTNPIGMNEYYAGGGLVPAGTTGTYGAVPSSGALSVQNFYGTSSYIPVYVEDLFSTYLYTGNSTASTYYQYIPTGTQFLNGAVNNTLIQMVGDTLTDSSPNPSTVTVPAGYDSPYVSSAQAKFGSYSIYFPATGSVLQMVPPAQFTPVAINGNAFCVQMWVYLPTSNADKTFFEAKVGNTTGFTLQTSGGGVMRMVASNPTFGTYTLGTGPSVGTWAHIALTCSGFNGTTNTFYYYLNGVNQGSVTFTPHSSSTFYPCYIYQIGSQNNGSLSDAYIDDFKVQAGSQVYTANFTPPTAPLALDTKITGKGGLFWAKSRSVASSNMLFDTSRVTPYLISNQTTAQQSVNQNYTFNGFNAQGATVLTQTMGGTGTAALNTSGTTYATWSFAEQPKFFDVVTYTGDGASTQTISHNLGSVPGCIIIKKTSASSSLGWTVWHRSLTSGHYLLLNTSATSVNDNVMTGANAPTATTFTAQLAVTDGLNTSGATYVAYLFAHNAGGFGLTGTDNIISCGSYTTDGSANATVTLGYEPQFLLLKPLAVGNWELIDNMRGIPTGSQSKELFPNTTAAETNGTNINLLATGFKQDAAGMASTTYIYIAIRRGPMKVPTDATKVYANQLGRAATTPNFTSGFPVDLTLLLLQNGGANSNWFTDRLRGDSNILFSYTTGAEITGGTAYATDLMNGVGRNAVVSATMTAEMFRRAPGFFDQVCYTGNATAGNTFAHNLGVVPELIIIKSRNFANSWTVYTAATGNTKDLFLNTTDPALTDDAWNNTTPTSSIVTLGAGSLVNGNAKTYVAYLFATCAGVSKVGSYTGTGALRTIACGFTGGARFVLIKRTDSASDWFAWDTARGMVSGNDYSAILNSTAIQTNANSVYTIATGFQLLASPAADVNTSGGTYIFLAIA